MFGSITTVAVPLPTPDFTRKGAQSMPADVHAQPVGAATLTLTVPPALPMEMLDVLRLNVQVVVVGALAACVTSTGCPPTSSVALRDEVLVFACTE
jgi:hypothetical protein